MLIEEGPNLSVSAVSSGLLVFSVGFLSEGRGGMSRL